MASGKYYITNGEHYVGMNVVGDMLVGEIVTHAKRFKKEEAQNIIDSMQTSYPDYCIQKYYSSSTRKNYVITNASQFIGDKNRIVTESEDARTFRSAADANSYIKNHQSLISALINPVIVNDKYETVDVFGNKVQVKEHVEKMVLSNSVNSQSVSRKKIPQDVRLLVYARDNGICKICGKPLSVNDFTVDHIVPLNRGGKDDVENLRCTCARCNKWKGDSLDEEMVTMLSEISSNYVYIHPRSDMSRKLIRMIVRGTIYGVNKQRGEVDMNKWASTD
jgi:hypothetical protein